VIASAITTLDLHDLARSACTYDIPACYIVTPLKDQQDLTARLLSHWTERIGKDLAPDRDEALRRLRVVESIEDALEEIGAEWGCRPKVWATSARSGEQVLSHARARRELAKGDAPHLMLFGTGWGLAPSVFEQVDGVLEPIPGTNGYNHLSVRCAAAILMDRLLHRQRDDFELRGD